jgi:hypothetical protein
MKSKHIPAIVIIVVVLVVLGSMALAAQDRFTLKAPNGVAVSQTDDGLKIIVGNTVMMNAYRKGIPGNGKPFPGGSKIVKIEWSKRKNPASPYPVMEPDTLKSVAFIQKDSKRFPETSGWGYAQFTTQRLTRLSLMGATVHSQRNVTGAIRL